MLDLNGQIRSIASVCRCARDCLDLGRGYNFPVALVGALKLREISYIHTEGYPAAEMKHGPIALIDQFMPVVFLAMKDATYEKVVSNIEEVVARKGCVIAITYEATGEPAISCAHVSRVPKSIEELAPVFTSSRLQLRTHHFPACR